MIYGLQFQGLHSVLQTAKLVDDIKGSLLRYGILELLDLSGNQNLHSIGGNQETVHLASETKGLDIDRQE